MSAADDEIALRVYRENLAALDRLQAGREETAAEANYRADVERRIAEIEGGDS